MPLPEADTQRIALVTGASRGIGRAIARALAAQGAHVVAVARTGGALEELDDELRQARPDAAPATLVPLDLADGEGIDRLGRAVFERFGRLDVLVGAAGVLGGLTPLAHVDPKRWDNILGINLTANWRLIRAFDPLLRLSAAGRALFITSGTNHPVPRAYWGPYAASKAGLNALAAVYAAETANTSSVKVTLVNPGAIATRMRAAAMPGEDPATLATPEALAAKVAGICAPDWPHTGKIYDFPTDSVMAMQAAQPL